MVPHDLILNLVKEKQILSSTEFQLLEFLLNSNYIIFENTLIKCNRGVPQGSLLSPFLFDLVMDPLVSALSSVLHPSEEILLYADDICIIFENYEQLSLIIKTAESAFQNAGLKLNKNKSGILFRSLRQQRRFPQTDEIMAVDSYKYLGVQIDRNLTLEEHRKVVARKCSYIASCLQKIPKSLVTPRYMTLLFSVLMKSLLLYGAEIISSLKKTYMAK